MPTFGLVATAMATPFTATGALDVDGAAALAVHLVDTGTDCVVVGGTTGESPTLHGEETWDVLRAVKDAVGDRARVLVGTGSNDTRHALLATERANEVGVDGTLVVTPYYNRPDARGLETYFTTLAEASESPVLLYDIPARAGREIPLDLLVELADHPNVGGVKDATGDVLKATCLLAATQGASGGFELYCGADELNLPLLAIGATGLVSVAAHLAGPQLAEMVACFPTDPARALLLHRSTLALTEALFSAASPAPLKGALARLGLPAGPVRPPLADATPEVVQAVLNARDTLEPTS